MQSIAKDLLVTEERVLDAGLLMIAGLLLPLATSYLANASDDAISRSTSTTSDLGALVHESKFGKTVAACTPIHIRTA
jgi:hypothetical protein